MYGEICYQIESLSFSGPLDLLLKLIRKDRYDICDIPIAKIADQYLSFVAKLPESDPEIISSFIVMAATLMDIKARILLPGARDDSAGEEDPREDLERRLKAYEHTRLVAGRLRALEAEAARFIYSERGIPEELKDYVPGVDIERLLQGVSRESLSRLYSEMLKRMKKAHNEQALEFSVIRRERASLTRFVSHLAGYARSHGRFKFREMLDAGADNDEVIVHFLALLELTRLGTLSLRQTRLAGDIDIEVLRKDELSALDPETVLDI